MGRYRWSTRKKMNQLRFKKSLTNQMFKRMRSTSKNLLKKSRRRYKRRISMFKMLFMKRQKNYPMVTMEKLM
jgi:hypothetical protein